MAATGRQIDGGMAAIKVRLWTCHHHGTEGMRGMSCGQDSATTYLVFGSVHEAGEDETTCGRPDKKHAKTVVG
jgi:hypothetical protein